MMFPPEHRPVQLMSPDSPSLSQIGMNIAHQLAHGQHLAAVIVVMQTPDGDVQMAGYTVGMGNDIRAVRHLNGVLDRAKKWCTKFMVNNEEAQGQG